MNKKNPKSLKQKFAEMTPEERRNFYIRTAWSGLKITVKSAMIILLVLCCVVGGLLIGVVAACVTTTDALTIEDLTTSSLTSFVYYADGTPITYTTEDGIEEIIKF